MQTLKPIDCELYYYEGSKCIQQPKTHKIHTFLNAV